MRILLSRHFMSQKNCIEKHNSTKNHYLKKKKLKYYITMYLPRISATGWLLWITRRGRLLWITLLRVLREPSWIVIISYMTKQTVNNLTKKKSYKQTWIRHSSIRVITLRHGRRNIRRIRRINSSSVRNRHSLYINRIWQRRRCLKRLGRTGAWWWLGWCLFLRFFNKNNANDCHNTKSKYLPGVL